MILGKLTEAYDRMVSRGALAAPHLVPRRIHLVVVLNPQGRALAIESLFTEQKQALVGQEFMAPPPPKGRSGITPPACLLCDRPDYALGIPIGKLPDEPEMAAIAVEKAAAAQCRFLACLEALPSNVQADAGVAAAIAFSRSPKLGELAQDGGLKAVTKANGPLVTFRLQGDKHPDGRTRLILERSAVTEYCRTAFDDVPDDALPEAVCSVTGERAPIARLHAKIRGVSTPDGKRAEATLVSFNNEAFESWGLAGGANAAVSVKAERAYTTALSRMTTERGRTVSGVTYVAWADGDTAIPTDDGLSLLFGDMAETPDEQIDEGQVIARLRAPVTGFLPIDDGTALNVLGLGPEPE